MRPRIRTGLIAAGLVAVTAALAPGQEPASLTLRAQTGALAEEFTIITAIRELSDGRVLIVDEKDNRLVVGDFSRDQVTRIGRVGGGPAEYRRVGRVWPLGGDTTLMVDPITQRRFTLVGSRIASSRPRAGGPTESGLIHGADRGGSVVTLAHSMKKGKLTGLRDSMFVVRGRANGRIDTIGRVPSEFANYDRTRPPATLTLTPPPKRVYRADASTLDQVVLFPDGWTAIARTNPYRVDWCAPSARCSTSPVIPETPRKITEGDQRAYIAMKARTSGWPTDLAPSTVLGWPESFPPFFAKVSQVDASPLIPAPDGRLLVERAPSTATPGTVYDVVDRSGTRVARLRLPDGQHVGGFGSSSVYIIETDADGVQRVRRHPWP